jgi:hypothetical protein
MVNATRPNNVAIVDVGSSWGVPKIAKNWQIISVDKISNCPGRNMGVQHFLTNSDKNTR